MENKAQLEQLTTNLREILNLIRDYEEEKTYHQNKWAVTQDEVMGNMLLTKITNCEAQIAYNEKQFKTVISQINQLLK